MTDLRFGAETTLSNVVRQQHSAYCVGACLLFSGAQIIFVAPEGSRGPSGGVRGAPKDVYEEERIFHLAACKALAIFSPSILLQRDGEPYTAVN